MSVKSWIAGIPGVRQIAVRVLQASARDAVIRNPWTDDPLKLNTFRHKGYWFYGREREARTMRRLAEIIRPGDTVWEVGGHIGFMAQHFARCVGPNGRLIVFEPGQNNLPYLRAHMSKLTNVEIVEKAVGATPGRAQFFEDNISGQNNSLLSEYHLAAATARTHGIELHKVVRDVEVITLDHYLDQTGRGPDVIKIDIEGAELDALLGGARSIGHARCLMVEITEQRDTVLQLLRDAGFSLSGPGGEPLTDTHQTTDVFAIRGDRS